MSASTSTLVEPDEGAHADTEPDAVAMAVGVENERLGASDEDVSPEEAAPHIVDGDAL